MQRVCKWDRRMWHSQRGCATCLGDVAWDEPEEKWMPTARGDLKVLTCTWTPPPAGSWHILHCLVFASHRASSPGASLGRRCNSQSRAPGFSLSLAGRIAAGGPTLSPALCFAAPGIGPAGQNQAILQIKRLMQQLGTYSLTVCSHSGCKNRILRKWEVRCQGND